MGDSDTLATEHFKDSLVFTQSMSGSTENGTYNQTEHLSPPETEFTIVKIIVFAVLFTVILVTIIGNIFVLISPMYEKKLRNTFVYFVLNLAVTDLGVAVTAMSFYAVDVLLGWWPFGEVRFI